MTASSGVLIERQATGRVRWISVTLAFAVVAFLASPHGPLGGFWRPSHDLPTPAGLQVPMLILLNLAESAAFGLGIACLLFGYVPTRAASSAAPALIFAAYLSIGWLLLNWWPHDSLHVANGMNLSGLLRIEYAFHITLMLAAAIVARFFFVMLADSRRRG